MKLAIFDKDGTLTTPESNNKFVQHPEDQVLLPGVAEGIAAMAADGWVMAIASNQGGVAAGHKSLDDAIEEMRFCLSLLPMSPQMLVKAVRGAVFCPEDGSECYWVKTSKKGQNTAVALHKSMPRTDYRKPGGGMLDAIRIFMQNPADPFTNVVFVGDRPEDEQAAAAAGVRFQWADEWRAQWQR